MLYENCAWHQDFKELVLEKLKSLFIFRFWSWLRLILCVYLVEAMAESQWSCKVILNPNHVKTMPRTCMPFILLNKKLLSCALLTVKPSHDSLINPSLSLAWQSSGSGSFSLEMCPWSNFHLFPRRESIQSSGGLNLSTFFSASTKDAFSFPFQWVHFLKVVECLAVIYCCFCMFLSCCFCFVMSIQRQAL